MSLAPSDSVEAWAEAFILAATWAEKLAPPPVPLTWSGADVPLRVAAPGRGSGFDVRSTGEKSTGKSPLRSARTRARLMHTFMHHELQAAELMAWAILAFPSTPLAFRRGLIGILGDEVRHMNLYARYLADRGFRPGDFAVRDWFWERVPAVETPAAFCATLGMGFEAANLDHAARFAARFRDAGDLDAAAVEGTVHREEIPHVLFATRWFARFTGASTPCFEAWRLHLPQPLSPVVMRGLPIDSEARLAAGADAEFVEALRLYSAAP